MSDTVQWLAPLVIGVVLIAGGAFLYVSNQEATENSVAVDAVVLSSEVYDDEPGDPPGDRENDDYRASIEYRYTYDGETYTSSNLCPGAGQGCAPSGDTPDEAEEFVAQYPDDETVTAYVQPDDPSRAYLVEGGSPMLYVGLAGVGVLVIVLGIRNFFSD